jgi:NAD-dependent dihydropyrimidine dehydrogenase PreA subunit/flavodoxin
MIFYFSGTGNSLQVARSIAESQGEKLVSIAALMNKKQQCYEFTLTQKEIVGFIYPIYAWNPPKMVLEFIRRLKFANYAENYVFSAVTCGDNIGNSMKTLAAVLKKKGLPLDSGFSIQMPNNYLVGMNVDSKEVGTGKLQASDLTLKEINGIISRHEKGVFKLEKGFLPVILTWAINPLFNSFAIRTGKFFATEQCTGCGICEKVCNCRNIKLTNAETQKDRRPVWGKECSQCLACIHYCPVRAAQYGKGTKNKGRYTNPNVSIREMSCQNIQE